MRNFIISVSVAALLAGCSSGGDGGADADGDGEITSEEMAAEAASAGSNPMRPGQWEQTMKFSEVNMAGMSGMPEGVAEMMQERMGSGFTITHCLTEEEVAQPSTEMFSGEGQEDCTYEEFDITGNRMTMRMTCNNQGGGTMKTAMEGEYGAESFELDVDTQMSGGPQGEMSMKGTVSGRRIGDCPSA